MATYSEDFVGPAFTQPGTIPKSPFQDLTAGSNTAQSVDAYRAGNPALWGNFYADLQSGKLRLGKYSPADLGVDENGNQMGTPASFEVLDSQGNPTQWKAYEVPNNPNAVKFTLTHGDYIQNIVAGTDPTTGYIAPIVDNSKQVEFHRWNYGSSGLSSLLQNPIAPLMLSALLPGAGSAIGSALGLGEGVLSTTAGKALLGGAVSELSGGDFAKGALTSGLGSLVGSALSAPSVDAGSLGTASDLPEIPQVSPLADTTITDTLFADTGLLPSTTIPVSDVVTPAEQVAEIPFQDYESIFNEMYPKGVSTDPTIGMTPDEKAYYYYKDYAKGWGEPVIPTLEDWQKYGGDYNAYKLATETSMPEAAIQTVVTPDQAAEQVNQFQQDFSQYEVPSVPVQAPQDIFTDTTAPEVAPETAAEVPGAEEVSAMQAASEAMPSEEVLAAQAASEAMPSEEVAAAQAASEAIKQPSLPNLTPSQIANLIKVGAGLFSGVGAATKTLTSTTGAVPTTGGVTSIKPFTGTYSGMNPYDAAYFQQVQQNYNRLFPSAPSNVATPLQSWYSTKFVPDTSISKKLFGV